MEIIGQEISDWLMAGDIAIQFQVERDLMGSLQPELQARILSEGWGARFMACRNENGTWGRGFYQPKWISSHYTLLDIKNLQPVREQPSILAEIRRIARERKGVDGGINPAKTIPTSDVCVNGMFLDYACYFGLEQDLLRSVVDYVLQEQMPDGGFNCQRIRPGASHSSLHSTISVLEGIAQYRRQGYQYRLAELEAVAHLSEEFILQHKLFRSDHTGETIHPDMLKLSYPSRWKYDILRALDYFQATKHPWDDRLQPAIDILLKKRRRDGCWPLGAHHAGKLHFEMEQPGQPSRWNTLRALRALKAFPQALQKR